MDPENREKITKLVSCDYPDCRALLDPQTIDELRAALEHWRDHELGYGCSHGYRGGSHGYRGR